MGTAAQAQREVYGALVGEIDTELTQRCIAGLTRLTHPGGGIGRIHLFVHSPGGQIIDGISLHNFFKAFPLELILYNSGGVESAGVLAFLGGRIRKASTYATFMIHRSTIKLEPGAQATDLQQWANMLTMEDERTQEIYRAAGVKLTDEQRNAFMSNQNLTITSQEALRLGFIHEIAEFSPPTGTTLFPL